MERQAFVARERELGRLDALLNQALASRGQVCFVTGEAGSGKTALVVEFARRAEEAHADLVVAIGNCNAHTGIGDPYLPFREILGMLTGDVEAKLAQGTTTQESATRLRGLLRWSCNALVEFGPDLIDVFVPGAGLAAKAGAFVADQMGWLEKVEELSQRRTHREAQERAVGAGDTGPAQSQIFEQYTNVLRALAEKRLLMLVVDDLQWADEASISLLFHLGRRIGESRMMVVGAYRPDEVALGRAGERHPLEKVLAEFKRYFGDIWVDLDRARGTEGRQFVDALLDTEPNRLGEAFRRALFEHTEGHPLFTVELLRDMRERGDLLQGRDGRLAEGPALDWGTLPPRVEGVIEERIGRLEDELCETLTVASVEGEDFTAQVLARVRDADERGLVRQLSGELDRKHRLVGERGSRQVGPQRLYLYRFRHGLFQQHLYSRLGESEREVLHRDVGETLEELYGEGAVEEVPAQLARHFQEARMAPRASYYLYHAGERARRLGASLEAVHLYHSALRTASGPGASGGLVEPYRIHERLGDVYLEHLSRHDEALEHYTSFLNLVESEEDLARGARKVAMVHLLQGDLGEAQEYFEMALARLSPLPLAAETSRVHCGLAYLFISRYRLDQAAGHASAGLEISGQVDDDRGLADANKALGGVAYYRGKLELACQYYERSLAIYRELGDLARAAQACNNVGDCCRRLGRMDQALEYLTEGHELARRIGDTRDEAVILYTTGELLLDQGRWRAAIARLEQALRLARESGVAISVVEVHRILGSAYHEVGHLEKARHHLETAETLGRDREQLRFAPQIYLGLARLRATWGEFAEASAYIESALDAAGPEPPDVFVGLLRRCRAYLHSRREEWDDAVVHLEASLDFLERTELPAEVGRTRLRLGEAYASRGAEGDGERALEQWLAALSAFRRIKARGYVAQVEARLAEIGYQL
jgi:tetratricopeptide (TPR) repeat protein